VEEQVTEQMIIRGSPEHCFDVLTSFEEYPQWAADIKSVSHHPEMARPRSPTGWSLT
jgi:hypothetical protein